MLSCDGHDIGLSLILGFDSVLTLSNCCLSCGSADISSCSNIVLVNRFTKDLLELIEVAVNLL